MSTYRAWRPPPIEWQLDNDEIHIWRVALQAPSASVLDKMSSTLASDEIDRVKHLRLQRDRERFIVARGILRILLGRYLGCVPQALHFTYNMYGKPSLDNAACRSPLSFNLSHAGGLALVAVTQHRALGVDIEPIRDDLALGQIADHFFSQAEQVSLRALPPTQQIEAFFKVWTRKEAYIKARGEGLSLALDSFDVSVVPGASAALLETRDDPAHAGRWTLEDLWPTPRYVAALAYEGRGCRINCWQWRWS